MSLWVSGVERCCCAESSCLGIKREGEPRDGDLRLGDRRRGRGRIAR